MTSFYTGGRPSRRLGLSNPIQAYETDQLCAFKLDTIFAEREAKRDERLAKLIAFEIGKLFGGGEE